MKMRRGQEPPPPYALTWFNPITGAVVNQTKTLLAGTSTFPKPAGIGSEAALFLRK